MSTAVTSDHSSQARINSLLTTRRRAVVPGWSLRRRARAERTSTRLSVQTTTSGSFRCQALARAEPCSLIHSGIIAEVSQNLTNHSGAHLIGLVECHREL